MSLIHIPINRTLLVPTCGQFNMALSVIEYAYKSAGDRRLVVFNFLWPWFGKKIPCQVDNPNIILLIISLIDMLLWGESMHKIRHYIIDSHCIPFKPQIVIGLSQLHPIVSIIIISQWSVYHKKTYIYIYQRIPNISPSIPVHSQNVSRLYGVGWKDEYFPF